MYYPGSLLDREREIKFDHPSSYFMKKLYGKSSHGGEDATIIFSEVFKNFYIEIDR